MNIYREHVLRLWGCCLGPWPRLSFVSWALASSWGGVGRGSRLRDPAPALTLSSAGTVFICSFMVAAPIFGYLGDRFNRKVILSCGIFFWSAVTFSSSFISQQVSLADCLPGSPECPIRSSSGCGLLDLS